MNRVDQGDMDRQEDQEDMEGQEAHFSALSQRIFLWPQGLFSKKEALSFSTKSKMIKSSLIFLTVLSFLVVFIGYSQILSKIANMNIAIQKLQGTQMLTSSLGNGNDKTQVSNKSLEHANAQAQMANSNLKNASDEIQVLKKGLENVNAQTQMANNNLKNVSGEILILKIRLENASAQTQMANSNLKNASDEIKRLKEDLENTNALNSETQSLKSGLEKANGEIQKMMGNLASTNNLKAEIQDLKEQLEILMAQQHQQSHQSSLLQLIIQGWSFYEGKAYYFSATKKTWDEAEGFCVSHNSHLASVTSDGEKEFLSKRTHGEYHWIGLTDKDSEGTWHWVDGTPFNESKAFWNKNQPDNWRYGKNLSEDCVHMLVGWNDMLCDKHYSWVCKTVPGLPEPRP